MGTTADKLNKLLETKAAIRQAIINKGVEVGEDVVFASYSAKIDAIEVGGGADEFLAMRTNNGTDMSYLFCYYTGTELDLSSLDTSKTTNMSYMFWNCWQLTTINGIEQWNMRDAIDMTGMFSDCYNLTELNLSNFNMTNVRNTDDMLANCNNLHTLRLDNFDNDTIFNIINIRNFPTGDVNGEARRMYVNPENVGDLEAPDGWIFVDLDGNEIVVGEASPYEEGEFAYNSGITVANTLVTEEHKDLSSMFNGCSNLAVVNTSKWDTCNVENMNIMFECCWNLPYLDLSSFKTDNVTNMQCMFKDCTNLLYLDISNFGVGEETDGMFKNCTSLLDLRLDNCDDKTINNIVNSFEFPTGTIDNVPRVIYIREEYQDGLSAPNNWVFGRIEDPVYITNKYNETKDNIINNREIVNVIVDTQIEFDRYEDNNLEALFENCGYLRLINGIEQWNTSGIEYMTNMFKNCTNLISLNLSSFDTSNARDMREMFNGCTNLRYLDLSNFTLGEYYNTDNMLVNCNNLRHLRLDNCDYITIKKITESVEFPTDTIDGVTRKIYVKEANMKNEWGETVGNPMNWEFVYVDVK